MSLRPENTTAVILGASEFPRDEALKDTKILKKTAEDFQKLLIDSQYFSLPLSRVHSLFDSDLSVDEQIDKVRNHLNENSDAQNIIIYYCGHGAMLPTREYCLATKRTNETRDVTTIKSSHLKDLVREAGDDKFTLLILDACYSGQALKDFIDLGDEFDDDDEAIIKGSIEALDADLPKPTTGDDGSHLSGTVLFCASAPNETARAHKDAENTMFSGALMEILKRGHLDSDDRVSVGWLAAEVTSKIKNEYGEEGRVPQVHVPVQDEAAVLKSPYFPNLAYRKDALENNILTGTIAAIKTDQEAIFVEMAQLREQVKRFSADETQSSNDRYFESQNKYSLSARSAGIFLSLLLIFCVHVITGIAATRQNVDDEWSTTAFAILAVNFSLVGILLLITAIRQNPRIFKSLNRTIVAVVGPMNLALVIWNSIFVIALTFVLGPKLAIPYEYVGSFFQSVFQANDI